jgi:hypothetical protein
MPTTNTTTSRKRKTNVKSSGKAAAAKVSASRRTGRGARKPTATEVKATRAKAARTRTANQTRSAVRQAETATRDTAGVFGDYAERAVLIPVGAALIVRDSVLSSVNDTISSYSSTSRAQAQLRRFEHRGVTARNRLEREVRKTRVRVERKLRKRRREIGRTVSDLEGRRDAVAKNGTELANRVPELANRVPELASRVQERVLNLV